MIASAAGRKEIFAKLDVGAKYCPQIVGEAGSAHVASNAFGIDDRRW